MLASVELEGSVKTVRRHIVSIKQVHKSGAGIGGFEVELHPVAGGKIEIGRIDVGTQNLLQYSLILRLVGTGRVREEDGNFYLTDELREREIEEMGNDLLNELYRAMSERKGNIDIGSKVIGKGISSTAFVTQFLLNKPPIDFIEGVSSSVV